MRKYNAKTKVVIITILSICLLTINSYAHSGRTDANGGHKDNKNKSGLGSYHYHCGGYPAHLHPNGVCPYTSSSSSSSTSSSTSSSKEATSVPSTVSVTSIQINETIDCIEVGKTKKLTATVLPDNATDKNVIWKSSDENIATISSTGEVTAKEAGEVEITASTSNGKSSTIKINIKEKAETQNITVTKTSMNSNETVNKNISNDNDDEGSTALGGILALGLLGGGAYIGYKKHKEKNNG